MLGECCCLWLSRYSCWWGKSGQCIMQIHNAQRERGEAKGQRRIFMFKFFLFCHKIWIWFHMYNKMLQFLHCFSRRIQRNCWPTAGKAMPAGENRTGQAVRGWSHVGLDVGGQSLHQASFCCSGPSPLHPVSGGVCAGCCFSWAGLN